MRAVRSSVVVTMPEVLVEEDGHVLNVALNAPATRNALSLAMLDGLASLFARPETAAGCRCIVVSSAEPGMFCSGFRLDGGAAEALRSGEAARSAERLFDAMRTCPVPIVAVIDGAAHGGGCELALRCHIRLGSTRATFGVPSAKLGLAYTPSSIAFMVEQLGPAAVAWVILAGQRLPAPVALQWALVQQVFEPEALEEGARGVADAIASSAPLVVAYLRRAIDGAASTGGVTPQALALRDAVLASADFEEALDAIEHRRRPLFQGL